MKFRKKPVVIEAEQFDGHNDPAGVFRRPEDNSPYVVTIHDQRCYVSPGDWIVPEPDGVHFYPVKPEIFEATYERVAESPEAGIIASDGASVQVTEHVLMVRKDDRGYTYHVVGIRGDNGENPGVLAVCVETDPSRNFPDDARIIVGAPAKSPLQEGYIPDIGGFCMSPAVATRVISTLQRAVADVQAAVAASSRQAP